MEKTNAMRILDQKKIKYNVKEYPHEDGVAVDGFEVARLLNQNPEVVFKTLVTIDNLKIVGARANNDGISIQSSDNVKIKNSFIRTWDDGIVVKNYAAGRYSHDITAENNLATSTVANLIFNRRGAYAA